MYDHQACDANHVNSHEKLILRLVEYHGCNVNMRDMHNRRPIDLLVKDKFMEGAPSATQLREELLIDRREIELQRLFDQFAREDMERTEAKRKAIITECIAMEDTITLRMWHCVREGARYKLSFGKLWERYEDPDTGNHFYARVPKNPLLGEQHDSYSWSEPVEAKALIDRTVALNYLMRVRSTLLRRHAEWLVFRCNVTQIEYYYHIVTEQLTFTTPAVLSWYNILSESTTSKERRLGYGNEWQIYTDKYDNEFYKNILTNQCEYDRPFDAVSLTPAELLCSQYQVNASTYIFQHILPYIAEINNL